MLQVRISFSVVYIESGYNSNVCTDLNIDESSMTGEPEPRTKNKKEPIIKSGTFVIKGAGRMLVLAVGSRSEWGQLIESFEGEEKDTPLQEKLEDIVRV